MNATSVRHLSQMAQEGDQEALIWGETMEMIDVAEEEQSRAEPGKARQGGSGRRVVEGGSLVAARLRRQRSGRELLPAGARPLAWWKLHGYSMAFLAQPRDSWNKRAH